MTPKYTGEHMANFAESGGASGPLGEIWVSLGCVRVQKGVSEEEMVTICEIPPLKVRYYGTLPLSLLFLVPEGPRLRPRRGKFLLQASG